MLIYLKSLLKYFPLTDQNLKQDERLIRVVSISFLYELYGLSDMFLFGRTSDVYNYWNCSLDESSIIEKRIIQQKDYILYVMYSKFIL